MFCSKCGTQLNEDAKFCNNCGNALQQPNLNQNSAQQSQTGDYQILQQNNQSGNSQFNQSNYQNQFQQNNANPINNNIDYSEVKRDRSFIGYLFLTVITLGIYSLFFWHKYIKDLNVICNDGDDSPNIIVLLLLSCITCGIYYYYWMYKQSNRIKEAAPKYNVEVTQDGTSVLLWSVIATFFFGVGIILGNYFMIANLNKITNKLN